MSRPRTRSQGPPEMEGSEEDKPTTAQRRMSRELQVRLETLRLLPARYSEGGKSSQTMATDSIKDGEASQCDPETTIDDSSGIKIKQCHGSTDNKRGKYQI